MVDAVAVESELGSLVARGLPGAFAYWEDADGASTFVGAGAADLVTGQPMQAEMHYRIGSTTKTFTTVVLLQHVAEGRVSVEDLVQQHVPDLPIPNGDRLTIEHLLRMRSGLFDFEDDESLAGDIEAHLRPVPLERVIEMALQGPVRFEPGERFEYCNSNFCLLEVVVERVSGRSLGAELRDRIFEPLGLLATTYPDEDDLSLPEPYMHGYEHIDTGWRECSEVFFGRGDGAIISTAADVARFFRALLFEQRLVRDDLLDQMTTVVRDDPSPEMSYGLGLYREDLPVGPVWGHAGGGFGYGHAPFADLENRRIAIVMRNCSFGYRSTYSAELADRVRFSPKFRSSLYG